MAKAICVRCGEPKTAPSRRCSRCALDPKLDDELLVRSVYFSEERFEDSEDREQYRRKLDTMRDTLRSGEQVAVDEQELDRLRAQLRSVREVRWRNVLGALVRIFLPAMIVLAALYGAIFALRILR